MECNNVEGVWATLLSIDDVRQHWPCDIWLGYRGRLTESRPSLTKSSNKRPRTLAYLLRGWTNSKECTVFRKESRARIPFVTG